ncbi:IBR finger domain-protein [Staphylotrichum tortipilum]|uniref:RBR-type E3 ubiquitin transferase n=1 Tax=Staphylotrichum tortipilum TaxID=2831512 RepID=A0AAN6RRE5_9PEZI|nr:IBR finger domain-protein [Staphylotrichum longicolle]
MVSDNVDPETLRAILEIQLEEIAERGQRSKGKGRQGAPPGDFDVALELLRVELSSFTILLKDNIMCQSMADAVWRDRAILEEVEREETRARQDRELAIQLSRGNKISISAEARTDTTSGHDQEAKGFEDEYVEKLAILFMKTPGSMEDDNTRTSGQPESSAWAQSRKRFNLPITTKTTECISCNDTYTITDVARCPCSHEYCRHCLATLFRTSMVDESLFPPRCCKKTIPLDQNRIFLPAALVGQFLAKKLELETPNRTYCHVPDCSAFIPPQFVQVDTATCVRCQRLTCTICKGAAHANECPQDEATQEVLRVAQENGWQRCYSCRRVVELGHGCNHMTCICRAEFCYECGLRWKTCRCEQWEEERLYVQAGEIVDRAARVPMDAARRERLVQREMRNQRRHHECVDHDWSTLYGEYSCQTCHDDLPQYIYECETCRILACRRCRYHRL